MPAFRPFVDPVQSLVLTLRSRTLSFVRMHLSVVSQLLAVIRDLIPLIGGAISFVSDPLAPQELTLTARHSLLAVIQLSGAPIEFAPSVSTVLSGHNSL